MEGSHVDCSITGPVAPHLASTLKDLMRACTPYFVLPVCLPCSTTCEDCLITCVIALLVEATLQQPVILLMTGVLGDFVEQGAEFLTELLDN